jgi:hypothetical protein
MTVQPIAIETTEAGSHVPEKMRAAIKKALAKSPDDRWPTVKDFLEAFTIDGAQPSSGAAASPAMRGGTAVMGAGGAAAAAPVSGDAAASSGGGPPRAKTEVGTPLDTSFGAPAGPMGGQTPPQGGPMSPNPYGAPPPQGGYGPPPGGAPYAAQAMGMGPQGYAQPGIPQAPPRSDGHEGGGGGKGLLLVLAGLLGVGAIVIVIFAVKGTSGPKEVDLGPINAGSTTSTTAPPTPPPPATDPNAPPADTSLAPLTSGKQPPVKPTGPNPITPPTHTTTSPTTPPTTPTAPPTTPPTTPPTPPPPAKEPSACAAARQMRALNMTKEFNNLAAQCRAQGGSV